MAKINDEQTLREKKKKYRQEHAEEIREYKRRYRQINKERIREYNRKYSREHMKEYAKKYRETHKERAKENNKKWYAENRGKVKEYVCSHRDKYKTYQHTRRAKRNLLSASYTVADWERCKKYFDNKCAYCGKEKPLQQEHFIPLLKGGEYTVNNIVPACGECNTSKHYADFFVWYPQQLFYSKTRERRLLKYLNYKNGLQQLRLIV